MEYKKIKKKGIDNVNKTSDNLGKAIYKSSSERILDNLKKGEIKY